MHGAGLGRLNAHYPADKEARKGKRRAESESYITQADLVDFQERARIVAEQAADARCEAQGNEVLDGYWQKGRI